MADTTKPVETAPVVAEPVVEAKPVEETPAVAATEATAPAAVEAESTPAAAETTETSAAAEETPVEEKKPVEEGVLSHKGEGANFPKNLIYSKKLFWFGTEPVDLKAVPSFKADKVADVAHHVHAWAAETGKGLLFFGEKDKAAPQGAVQLAEASEPSTDGANKFFFTSKGHKHTFKAATAAERDAWVAELKAKIEEAKALAATITESETYKKTLEALKPAKKEEKAAEPVAEAAAAPAAAVEETPAAAATEASATEAAVTEAPQEEAKKEEAVVEEPKRRSASRKRASIFGSFLGKKEEKKAEAVAEPEAAATETAAVPTEAAAAEIAAAPVEAAAAAETTETPKAEEKAEEVAESKPPVTKRQSIFSNLSFGKKKVASPEPTPVAEAAPATEAVAETAPVIPAVETTEPLSTEVSSPATVPTETVDATPAAASGETKKEVKSDKRKSSLPFIGALLSPKEKTSATSDEETEKPKSPSPFSKLRDTIKGKKAVKAEKPEEKTEEAVAEDAAAEEAAKPVETAETEAVVPATTEEAPKTTPAVPVVSAAA